MKRLVFLSLSLGLVITLFAQNKARLLRFWTTNGKNEPLNKCYRNLKIENYCTV